MRNRIMILSTAVVMLGAGYTGAQQQIADNGFEEELVPYSNYPDWPEGSWVSWWDGVSLDSTFSYSGFNSLRISTGDSVNSGFVHYSLRDKRPDFEMRFRVYPESDEFDNIVVIGADWMSNNYKNVLLIRFSDTFFMVRAGLASTIVADPQLVVRAWNLVEVRTGRDGTDIEVYVNGSLAVTALNTEPIVPDIIFIGDYTVSTHSLYGTLYYDEVSLTNRRGNSFFRRDDMSLKKGAAGGASGLLYQDPGAEEAYGYTLMGKYVPKRRGRIYFYKKDAGVEAYLQP